MAEAEASCRAQPEDAGERALDRLQQREEILQICYWYQGEGFGSDFTPGSVIAFLQADPIRVAATFEELAEAGDLQRVGRGYTFTPEGKRKAARMFVEGFTDFQQPGHGECMDGCCDGDEPCNAAHTNCDHTTPYRSMGRPAGGLICDEPNRK